MYWKFDLYTRSKVLYKLNILGSSSRNLILLKFILILNLSSYPFWLFEWFYFICYLYNQFTNHIDITSKYRKIQDFRLWVVKSTVEQENTRFFFTYFFDLYFWEISLRFKRNDDGSSAGIVRNKSSAYSLYQNSSKLNP
jgi:hypothetical protein